MNYLSLICALAVPFGIVAYYRKQRKRAATERRLFQAIARNAKEREKLTEFKR